MKRKAERLIITALFLSVMQTTSFAYDTYNVPETNPSFSYKVFDKGEKVPTSEGDKISFENFSNEELEALKNAGSVWSEIINTHVTKPASFYIYRENEENAGADSQYFLTDADPNYSYTAVQAALQNKTISYHKKIDGEIVVGIGPIPGVKGFNNSTNPIALHHGRLPRLDVIMEHEIGHAMGIASLLGSNSLPKVQTNSEEESDPYYYYEGLDEQGVRGTDPTYKMSIWDSFSRFYDSTIAFNKNNQLTPYLGSTDEIKQLVLIADTNMDDIPADFKDAHNIVDLKQYVPYFVGKKTLQVLSGSTSEDIDVLQQKIAEKGGLVNYSFVYNNDSTKIAYGLPIHPYDPGQVELSHIELRNSYMSHQNFRNWVTFMEAELAALYDIGYTNINLKNYFGKSYYLNNVSDTYSQNYLSPYNQAIGLHIYGDNNDITQAGDIKLTGNGTFGVRIDGVEDNYTLQTDHKIETTGNDSISLGATFGKNHIINIKEDAIVSATGKNSPALSFDFGSNILGEPFYIKGSYIDYGITPQEEEKTPKAKNIENPDTAILGALANEVNISGNIKGESSAIYIADNAYVKDININATADIQGDVISNWNSITAGEDSKVIDQVGADGKVTNYTSADDIDTIKFTNINFKNGSHYHNGQILGSETFNTIKLKTEGNVEFKNANIDVYSLSNAGTTNIENVSISTSANPSLGQIFGHGTLNVKDNSSLLFGSNVRKVENTIALNNNSTLNLANGETNNIQIEKLVLNNDSNLVLDADVTSNAADKLLFANEDAVVANNNSLNTHINFINPMSMTDQGTHIINITTNNNLLKAIDYKPVILTSPIFLHKFNFDKETGNLIGSLPYGGGASNYRNFNSSVLASSVAAQVGGYLTQLNSYDEAFANMDMIMLLTPKERNAMLFRNKLASSQMAGINSSLYTTNKSSELNKGLWFRPYATFEKVGLRNGPKVENTAYGSYFGGDSDIIELKKGWNFVYSGYAGYDGSHQNYDGVSIYQNGGHLGATGVWYKGNFFTGLTANVGASVADTSTMYGSEDIVMLMTGIASKTGYNFNFANDKFIIQPSWLMSYSMVHTFDYKNASGVDMHSSPLNAIQLAPQLKFIGNLSHGWQPYISLQMIWNIMDETKFKAMNVNLPEMSVKPYFQYGVGVQKRWGDRCTGYLQAMLRNGGRNGIAFSLGFKWALGKDSSEKAKSYVPEKIKTNISLSSAK